MPEPNGDRIQLRAYLDPKTDTHKLEVHPESLRVCKRKTRVVSVSAKNETVGTKNYRPILLGYRLSGGGVPESSTDPKHVFQDGPNDLGASFLVPDDGRPCYFTIKDDLGIAERSDPCSFVDEDPKYAVIIRFRHEGWADPAGSGDHHDWHTES